MHEDAGYNSPYANSSEIRELKSKIKEMELKIKISNKDMDMYGLLLEMKNEIDNNKKAIQSLIQVINEINSK